MIGWYWNIDEYQIDCREYVGVCIIYIYIYIHRHIIICMECPDSDSAELAVFNDPQLNPQYS